MKRLYFLALPLLLLMSCSSSDAWEKYAGQWSVADDQTTPNCFGGIVNYNVNILQDGTNANKIRIYNFADLWSNAYVTIQIESDGSTLTMQEQNIMDVNSNTWNVQLISGEMVNDNLITLNYRIADFCVFYGNATLTK